MRGRVFLCVCVRACMGVCIINYIYKILIDDHDWYTVAQIFYKH